MSWLEKSKLFIGKKKFKFSTSFLTRGNSLIELGHSILIKLYSHLTGHKSRRQIPSPYKKGGKGSKLGW
jgi:hypothetical protein